ncbi:MAG: response regulator [Limnohabitans sp.]|nr:response regulator [Limnohabitans sp.]
MSTDDKPQDSPAPSRQPAVDHSATAIARGSNSMNPASRTLELLGQGVGIVEATGEVVWMNHGLAQQSPETMRRFADTCTEAIRAWQRLPNAARTLRGAFRSDGSWYEVIMTPMVPEASGAQTASPTFGNTTGNTAGIMSTVADGATQSSPSTAIHTAVALLVDATATRKVQDRLDAVDHAGSELLRIDVEELRSQPAPERLRALESRVVGATRSVLGFDHFEYRLTERRTGQLELVFCSGLVPLGIGERIFARTEANGLSGIVASTGESIVCTDVSKEPRYIRGLPGAQSTLTVPLRMHERVIGVLNVESKELARFDDEDRIGAELLGRYVALALQTLDLLVAERCDTLRAMSATLAREAAGPLAELANDARAFHTSAIDETARERALRMVEHVARLDELLRNVGIAQRGILGAEEFMREGKVDPVFAGRTVLVADDDETTRTTVREVFEQQGAIVSECPDGLKAITLLRARANSGQHFDLVISDIRMPDANGYEVFRATKDASPETPVILMTAFGYDPNHSIVRSSQEGLHCFLFKPIEIAQLLDEARKALAARPMRA